MQSLLAGRRFIGPEFLFQLGVSVPHLTQEQRIEQFRRVDDLLERLPIFRRQFFDVSGQVRGRKPRDLFRELGIAG